MSQKIRGDIALEIQTNLPTNAAEEITAAGLREVVNDLNDSCFNLLSDVPIMISQGGTGQITANNALNTFLPNQTGNSGKVLGTDGTNTSWVTGGGGGGSPGGASGTVQYNNAGSFGGFGSWNGSLFNVGGDLTASHLVGQYSNALGSAYINPDGSAVFGGGGAIITNTGSITGSNLSGTNTGDQTNITGNAGTVTTINSLIQQGTNVTITGSGTSGSPYVINSSGGGGGGTIATTTLVLKGDNAGNAIAATVGTDYVTGSSTNTFTNKTFDADGTGNSITNIENADIKAAAAIAVNKLAALTVSRAVVTDGSGFVSAATTTSTEIGYVNGVTSAIQTQLNGKQTSGNYITALTGDVTASGPGSVAGTLATVNANVGTFGSATQVAVPTVNAKGLITAISNTTITPAVGSITGLGTSVATALAVNVGTAGAFVVSGGALGTPSSGVATNLTGTASGLTAGNVTTNANLTGVITSVGNATSFGTFTSAQILAGCSDETGTGLMAFATNPTLSGATFADATNIVLNTTTGTKIGTATGQKLGFFNATPVIQQTGNIITALSNLGLITSGTITGSNVTGAALTKTDDTNVTLTLGGTPASALLQASSLTLGWTGTLSGTRGGTGVNNGASTITLGGSLTTSGAFTTAFTVTANTAVTLPTTGTLATLAGSEALTNKSVNGVTLTTGGSATTYLNGTGAYSTPAGGGTVTTVSVVSANGFAGTVATATSTPAITLTTSITGILKGNGTAISAATAGTDYLTPSTGVTSITGTTSQVIASAATGAVTLSLPQSIATTSLPTFDSLTLNSTTPTLTLYQNDVGTDAKRWDWTATGGSGAFDVRTLTDAGAFGMVAWQCLRGGNTNVTGQLWYTVSGGFTFTSNTLGALVMNVTSVGTTQNPSRQIYQGRVATTDATVTTLLTLTIPSSTTYMVDAYVTARRTGGVSGAAEDGAGYIIRALVKNVAGTATLIGSSTTTLVGESTGTMDAVITVTGATALVRVTGVAATNFTWHCTADTYQTNA